MTKCRVRAVSLRYVFKCLRCVSLQFFWERSFILALFLSPVILSPLSLITLHLKRRYSYKALFWFCNIMPIVAYNGFQRKKKSKRNKKWNCNNERRINTPFKQFDLNDVMWKYFPVFVIERKMKIKTGLQNASHKWRWECWIWNARKICFDAIKFTLAPKFRFSMKKKCISGPQDIRSSLIPSIWSVSLWSTRIHLDMFSTQTPTIDSIIICVCLNKWMECSTFRSNSVESKAHLPPKIANTYKYPTCVSMK